MTTQFYIPGTLVTRARALAMQAHGDTNHRYGELPYAAHLSDVASLAICFISLIPDQWQRDIAVASAWLHDSIEDARLSYNDISKTLGVQDVAEVVFCLTNNKGRTRYERADAAYYAAIRKMDLALFVKLCDRLSHALNARSSTSTMLPIYRAEHPHFESELRDGRFAPMWQELDRLLGP